MPAGAAGCTERGRVYCTCPHNAVYMCQHTNTARCVPHPSCYSMCVCVCVCVCVVVAGISVVLVLLYMHVCPHAAGARRLWVACLSSLARSNGALSHRLCREESAEALSYLLGNLVCLVCACAGEYGCACVLVGWWVGG